MATVNQPTGTLIESDNGKAVFTVSNGKAALTLFIASVDGHDPVRTSISGYGDGPVMAVTTIEFDPASLAGLLDVVSAAQEDTSVQAATVVPEAVPAATTTSVEEHPEPYPHVPATAEVPTPEEPIESA